MSLDEYAALDVLNSHHKQFYEANAYAQLTKQPTPEDSRAWSQVLISTFTGTSGLARHKGQDFSDGSDVKSANAWNSIDKVRFNGVIKSGTKSTLSNTMAYLDNMPYLFFVLWDHNSSNQKERARIWVVQPPTDTLFRNLAQNWYNQQASGQIKSNNLQLHPPVNDDSNVFTNECGNLVYPLLLSAEWDEAKYVETFYNPDAMTKGKCAPVT